MINACKVLPIYYKPEQFKFVSFFCYRHREDGNPSELIVDIVPSQSDILEQSHDIYIHVLQRLFDF